MMKGGVEVDQVKIGNFLKKLRKEKGITQEQLAEILNVSGRTVSRWETGNNMPDISIGKLFDIIIMHDVIEHIADKEKLLKQCQIMQLQRKRRFLRK